MPAFFPPKIYLFKQVPIIKMVDLPTEVKVDISINNDSSVQKAELIRVSSDLLCWLDLELKNNFAKLTQNWNIFWNTNSDQKTMQVSEHGWMVKLLYRLSFMVNVLLLRKLLFEGVFDNLLKFWIGLWLFKKCLKRFKVILNTYHYLITCLA